MTNGSSGHELCVTNDADAQLLVPEQAHLTTAFCTDVWKGPVLPRNMHAWVWITNCLAEGV